MARASEIGRIPRIQEVMVSSLQLREMSLKGLGSEHRGERARLIESDEHTIKVWREVASDVVKLMKQRQALDKNSPDADPEKLVQRFIMALAHPDFYSFWVVGTLSPRSKAEKVTFGEHFDSLHNSGRRKPRSSWTDLGMSLLIEMKPPWWAEELPESESRKRFHQTLWWGEVVRRIQSDPDCLWLLSELRKLSDGGVEDWLWKRHWASPPIAGPYVGRPPLGPYLANSVRHVEGKSKKAPPVDPTIMGALDQVAPADAHPHTDADEAEIYIRLLKGATINAGRQNQHGAEQIRYPEGKLLRDLLHRNEALLRPQGLHNVLERLVDHKALTPKQKEVARLYFLDGHSKKEIAGLNGWGSNQAANFFRALWQKIQVIENEPKMAGLVQALELIVEKSCVIPPEPDDWPPGPGGGSAPDSSAGDQPSTSNDHGSHNEASDQSNGGDTDAENARGDGLMRFEEPSADVVRAIQGITNLQTGEWSRDEVPAELFANWVEVLGADFVGEILGFDRDGRMVDGPSLDELSWPRIRDEMRLDFERDFGRGPSPKTERVLHYVDGQSGWTLAIRSLHYRQGLKHEKVLSAVAGPGGEASSIGIDAFREPSGILYTAVRPRGVTRWKTRIGSGETTQWKLTSTSGHESWIQSGAVRLEDGEIFVDGGLVPSASELGVFVVSTQGRFSEGTAEVFVIRSGDEPEDNAGPESLAEAGLLVDAWRAMVASPGARPDEIAEFLLLFVFDAMSLAARDVPTSALRDRGVEKYWGQIVNSLDPSREALRDLFAPEGR